MVASWAGRRVLVTGAGGFIGSHLVEALVGRGAIVTTFVRYNSRGDPGALANGSPPLASRVRVIAGDLKDPAALLRAVQGSEVVFHLGALIGIPYSYVHPLDYVQTNVAGTAHLLEACRHQGISKLVLFSTSEVYGTARYVPIDEAHPLQGQSPYAASKIAADHLALSYYKSFGLPVAIARPFNTYGPRQPSRAVIPTIIGQCLAGRTVRLGSLMPLRDLTYVSDTVAGALRLAEAESTIGEVVNLGSSKAISIGDLANEIFTIMGGDYTIEADAARMRPENSEVLRLLADSSKAGRLLGWRPIVPLKDGLQRTVEWMRDNAHREGADRYHV